MKKRRSKIAIAIIMSILLIVTTISGISFAMNRKMGVVNDFNFMSNTGWVKYYFMNDDGSFKSFSEIDWKDFLTWFFMEDFLINNTYRKITN